MESSTLEKIYETLKGLDSDNSVTFEEFVENFEALDQSEQDFMIEIFEE